MLFLIVHACLVSFVVLILTKFIPVICIANGNMPYYIDYKMLPIMRHTHIYVNQKQKILIKVNKKCYYNFIIIKKT